MPPSQKTRKKPKAPQVIAPEIWTTIEKACCAGLGYSAAARRFGVSVFAIMARSKRNKWPVGSRIQRRVEALQEARYKARERYKAYEQRRNGNAEVIEAVAQSWAKKASSIELSLSNWPMARSVGLPKPACRSNPGETPPWQTQSLVKPPA